MALSHTPRTPQGEGSIKNSSDKRVSTCVLCGHELVPSHVVHEDDIQLRMRDEDDIQLLLRVWLDKLDRRLEAWEVKHEQLLRRCLVTSPPSVGIDGSSLPDSLEKLAAVHFDIAPAPAHRETNYEVRHVASDFRPVTSGMSYEVQPMKLKATTGKSVRETLANANPNVPPTRFSLSKSESITTPSMRAKLEASHRKSLSQKNFIGPLEMIVTHRFFNAFVSLSILTNAIFIGVQTEMAARGLKTEQGLFMLADIMFFTLFSVELILRILFHRLDFLKTIWNMFDTCLVLMQFFEFALKLFGGSMDTKARTGQVMRVIRIVRIVRVFRLLRFFMQLRVMIRLIVFSLDALFWLMILLIAMMYIFAIVFTQGVHDHLMLEAAQRAAHKRLKHNFGDLGSSILTLFQTMTNGVDWGELCEDLFAVQFLFGLLLILFIFFVFFSVLNIVTGVFVDNAIQQSGQEREQLVEREQKSLDQISTKLMELLHEVDTDASGTITLDELVACAEDAELSSYLAALQIHTPETAKLFEFLDKDGNGEIDLREFIDGCIRLRGHARNVDLHLYLFQVELQMKIVLERHEQIASEFKTMGQLLASALVSWGVFHPEMLKSELHPVNGSCATSSFCLDEDDQKYDVPREESESKVGKVFPRSRVTACKPKVARRAHVHTS